MNSFYGLKRCLLPLVEAKKRGKKTAVYSQSIGPLNERDKKLLTKYSKSIDVILVRDDYSRDCINAVKCFSKVFQTKDAAFLLPPRPSKAQNSRTIAVSVREWNYENRDMDNFANMIQSFCEYALKQGFTLEFISTCQGVPNYRDDSQIANKIKANIASKNPSFEPRMLVDSSYHTFYNLADRLNSRYCFTIGTRLHMCILSLINGTPAFNISYEVKGRECYRYLDLEEYSIDYNEPKETADEKFKRFVASYSMVQASLLEKLLPIHEESKDSLDQFLKEMEL
jgi:colanic acid/amylovoran biosynthesis protein